jgi:hypothetical protein
MPSGLCGHVTAYLLKGARAMYLPMGVLQLVNTDERQAVGEEHATAAS